MSAFTEPEYVIHPDCGEEMTWWDDDTLGNYCAACRVTVTTKPVEPDDDHRPVSLDGWTCEVLLGASGVCGRSVNGQTDSAGVPLHDGWVVKHGSES